MHDIRLAVALMAFLSIAVFLMTRRLLRSFPRRGLDVIAVGLMLVIAAYMYYVWGQLWIVAWIPLPSVIVLSNWFPLLLSVLAAIVWLRLRGDAGMAEDRRPDDESSEPAVQFRDTNRGLIVRRTVVMTLIVVGGVYSVMYFIPISTPKCRDEWAPAISLAVWPVCLQTNPNTCSAASSATILNTLGIKTTEQEMARLCLTRRGTTWLGLYHGLSTKLIGTNHIIEFFETDIARLPTMAKDHPVLLCCRLDPKAARDVPEYVTEGGWKPGTAHSVVYFGEFLDRHVIGDPSRGYELWTNRDLEILWTRKGLQIGHLRPVRPDGT